VDDRTNATTSGGNSTFSAICSKIEDRLSSKAPHGPRRDELLRRVRTLRADIDSWVQSPPGPERRSVLTSELLTLQREAEELTTG
jgi:hypothetical protein